MSLKQKTIAGIGWNGFGSIIGQSLQIVSLVVLARYLSPEAFGVYAILMVFVNFMGLINTMGTSRVIVYMDETSQRMLSSIFYLNITISLMLFALFYFLAWPIATFFENHELVHLLQIIGLIFIINASSTVQRALLEKTLSFKRIVVFETTALVFARVTGIIAAVCGLGVYSLIITALANSSVVSILLWKNEHWKPSLSFSLSDIKYIWRYTFHLTGFGFVNYFARHADNFLIGKYINSSALGVYDVAYKIMLYPLQNIANVLIRVLFPAFSQVKHDNVRFKNGYVKSIAFIAMVSFPVMMGLLAIAKTFVVVVLGDKWAGMAGLLMIFAPIGMIQSIVSTVGTIYIAKGTTDRMLKIGTINALVTIASFAAGLPYGVLGVATAYAVANILMLYPILKYSWDQIELRVFEGLRALSPFFVSSLVMSAIVYYQGAWFSFDVGLSLFVTLYIQLVTGVLIYFGILLLLYRKVFLGLLKELASRDPR